MTRGSKSKSGVKKNRIVIYKIRKLYSETNNIISRDNITVVDLGENKTLYIEDSLSKVPKYVTSFLKLDPSKFRIFSASSKALLVVRGIGANDEAYAVAFGGGRFFLNRDSIEKRFGLKTALNVLDNSRIRNLSKTKLEVNPKKSVEQLAHVSTQSEFGVDISSDLLQGVSGKVSSEYNEALGDMIAGSDSLTLSVECDIDNIDELLVKVSEVARLDTYKNNFSWIDSIIPVKEEEVKSELDDRLVELIANFTSSTELNGKLWATIPELLIDEDIGGYKIGKEKAIYDDVSKALILERIEDCSIDSLKKLKIFAMSSDGADVIKKWSSYECLYAEIRVGKELAILVDGEWYKVEKDFKQNIDTKLMDNIKYVDTSRWACYNHDNEGSYNISLAESLDGKCLDKKSISSLGYGRVEVCDVLSNVGQLVHVKRYTSGSPALGHLFNQGLLSGELLKMDEDYKNAVERMFDCEFTGHDEIIFCIITKNPDGNFELPFFSKVALWNVYKRLTSLGYTVKLAKIKNLKAENV